MSSQADEQREKPEREYTEESELPSDFAEFAGELPTSPLREPIQEEASRESDPDGVLKPLKGDTPVKGEERRDS